MFRLFKRKKKQKLIMLGLCDVQPMTGPVGQIFTLKVRYGQESIPVLEETAGDFETDASLDDRRSDTLYPQSRAAS